MCSFTYSVDTKTAEKKSLEVFSCLMLFVTIAYQYGTKALVEKLHQFDHVLTQIAGSAKEEFDQFFVIS